MAHKNYYDILGVSTKASLDEITAAKNALAKKYHPDVNLKDGIDTTEQMQEILELSLIHICCFENLAYCLCWLCSCV